MSAYEENLVAGGQTPDTEASAVANIAVQGVEPKAVEVGRAYAVPDGRGGVKIIDTDAYAEAPRHTEADRRVNDAASFVAYIDRHGTPATEVYAHQLSSSVVAIIDSHLGAYQDGGRQKHTLTLVLEHTKAWAAWAERDLGTNPRGWFDQQEFAEFIEDRALDVREPDHARLIEAATKFEAVKNVDFGQATRLDNGEVQFQYTETVGAKKGTKDALEFPKELKLALRPYVGGPTYHVFANLRYRVSETGLRLGFALVRPEAILEGAFADIVTEIRDGRTDKPTEGGDPVVIHKGIGETPIFYGKPRT
ncbi:DUF2303 family protein [Leifsonia aquatica]|uniref:DUF2303 family protein n=1 Tax=Leifsonia aquatica TaxID=144185 RepID=UPI003812CC6A